ncbi:MAG: sugar ABC transporter permease [Clostridia bacterium]|nr:sugar ABC transporter permease [Clostridia bacterium]
MKRRRIISNTVVYIVLVIMSIVWLFPFVCLVLQSFRVESTGIVYYIIPKQWGFDNYINLFKNTNFLKWYRNTLIIAIATAVLQTLFVMLMAYGLSRLRFKGRKFLMNVMLILGMFPGFLTMIILYWVLKDLGLTQDGTIGGLILVYVASSGMGYYVAKGFLDTIPKSLDEAARIDGATRFQVFYKIIIPMARPIVIYTVLTAFMAPWADFIFASYIAMSSPDNYNVAVGLWNLLATNSGKDQYYTMFCAGGVLVAIPVTVLFMCLQKYYVAGVTGGAVKG